MLNISSDSEGWSDLTSRIDWENNQHFVPHPPVSCKMIFEEQVHKFLTDGISLPRSGYCFWLDEANIQLIWNSAQVCSDAWSVRNFRTNSSDIILWGNHIQVQNERKNVRFHKLWHLKGCYNGNDNEERKVRGWTGKTTTLHEHHVFLVHFFTITAWLCQNNTLFSCSWRT